MCGSHTWALLLIAFRLFPVLLQIKKNEKKKALSGNDGGFWLHHILIIPSVGHFSITWMTDSKLPSLTRVWSMVSSVWGKHGSPQNLISVHILSKCAIGSFKAIFYSSKGRINTTKSEMISWSWSYVVACNRTEGSRHSIPFLSMVATPSLWKCYKNDCRILLKGELCQWSSVEACFCELSP